ncbi:MAG: hypothetical protein JSS62_01925 [Verrucomicrobia bacterium]|nr:hypothetical protein [Verrucomicrobiota bacterium]MBS0645536.1 hypothetical protein [Verrucomicrobiota bacterium]
MAAATFSSDKVVTCHMFWNGSYTYHSDWALDTVKVTSCHLPFDVLGKINTIVPTTFSQHLMVRMVSKSAEQNPTSSLDATHSSFSCSTSAFRHLTFSVLTYYSDRSQGHLPVHLSQAPIPEVREGKTICINFSYPQESETILASFSTYSHERVTREITRQAQIAGIVQGTDYLVHKLVPVMSQPLTIDLQRVLAGLHQLINHSSEPSNPELDALSKEELLQKFAHAKQERLAATRAFKDDINVDTLTRKQKAIAQLGALSTALQRKGVILDPADLALSPQLR